MVVIIIFICKNCPYYSLEKQYCDKSGGEILMFGYCEDVNFKKYKNYKNQHLKQKKINKIEKDQKYKNHLKNLAKNIQYYPHPVIFTKEIYIKGKGWIENLKPYYKRNYRDNHRCGRYKYYKKYANRCVRKYQGEIHNKGNQYKKIFDYWWTVD